MDHLKTATPFFKMDAEQLTLKRKARDWTSVLESESDEPPFKVQFTRCPPGIRQYAIGNSPSFYLSPAAACKPHMAISQLRRFKPRNVSSATHSFVVGVTHGIGWKIGVHDELHAGVDVSAQKRCVWKMSKLYVEHIVKPAFVEFTTGTLFADHKLFEVIVHAACYEFIQKHPAAGVTDVTPVLSDIYEVISANYRFSQRAAMRQRFDAILYEVFVRHCKSPQLINTGLDFFDIAKMSDPKYVPDGGLLWASVKAFDMHGFDNPLELRNDAPGQQIFDAMIEAGAHYCAPRIIYAQTDVAYTDTVTPDTVVAPGIQFLVLSSPAYILDVTLQLNNVLGLEVCEPVPKENDAADVVDTGAADL